jgi:hypothetical protein
VPPAQAAVGTEISQSPLPLLLRPALSREQLQQVLPTLQDNL